MLRFALGVLVLLGRRRIRLTGASCGLRVKLVILVPMLDLLFEIEVLGERVGVAVQSHVVGCRLMLLGLVENGRLRTYLLSILAPLGLHALTMAAAVVVTVGCVPSSMMLLATCVMMMIVAPNHATPAVAGVAVLFLPVGC